MKVSDGGNKTLEETLEETETDKKIPPTKLLNKLLGPGRDVPGEVDGIDSLEKKET